jgi:lipoprotein-releasing system ATP-binding protein
MSHPLLQARNLHKTFKGAITVNILKGIDLTVKAGESVAIMGRSGQGKSTLLQILGTLDIPSKGEIHIAGNAVSRFNSSRLRNQHLAFVFQSFHLLDDYSAISNVLMPAAIARQSVSSGSPAHVRGMQLLDLVGLKDRAHFNTKLLSGGEKQRVAIARALCNNPSLILADEPSGNLDKETSTQIHKLLLDFSRQEGKAIIVVTHDQTLAGLCQTQYWLEDGLLSKSPKI